MKLFTWDGQMWATCKLRKPSRDAITGEPIEKGATAFRPLDNSQRRWRRLKLIPRTAVVLAAAITSETQ